MKYNNKKYRIYRGQTVYRKIVDGGSKDGSGREQREYYTDYTGRVVYSAYGLALLSG